MARVVLALVVAAGCSEPDPAPESEARRAVEEPADEANVTEDEPPPTADPCDTEPARLVAEVRGLIDAHAACEFAVDCVEAPFETSCASHCGVAVGAAGLEALRARLAEIEAESCPELGECTRAMPECARSSPSCVEGRCLMNEGDPVLAEVVVPAPNARDRSDSPPRRPPAGPPEQERARRLFAAIVADDPVLAQDFFFPKEAFRHVKAIADPDGYWDRLFARYARDIHELHEQLGDDADGATFDRLEIVRRGGWVPIGDEGNALPYHVARHNWLHYTVGGEARKLEVRVVITWGERWYITHLNEFH